LKDHLVAVDIEEDLPLFKLDYGLMEQVLFNLVQNAAVYTKNGSLITIKATVAHEKLLIVVEDSGAGLPESEQGKVFDKFYRVNNSTAGGTGLGLSIVKGFVEAHNGTVALNNNAAGGAAFTITIPAEKWL